MRNKFLLLTIIFALFFFLGKPKQAHAQQIPPKVQVFLTVCGYGTVGGALLGFATMAFDSSTIAIAQGASLGLYAGILFGTYVLLTYNDDPYSNEGTYSLNNMNNNMFLAKMTEIEAKSLISYMPNSQSKQKIPLYLNLLNYKF
jgi:hypothetical protein